MRTTPPWPGRAEPGDVADASGDPERHGVELLLEHVSWLRQVIAEEQLSEEPRRSKGLLMLFQPGTSPAHR